MKARLTPVPTGDGPFCPYCGNSSAEYKANPETFDIHDHVQRCAYAYQARYRAYAAAHGLSPAAMSRHDRKRHQEASGLCFILWMGEQWRTWGAANKRARPYTVADHVAFDAWLESWCFVRRLGMELQVGDSVEVSSACGVQLGKVEGFVAGDVGENFSRPSIRTDSGRLFVGCHPEYVRRVGNKAHRERTA